MTTEAEAKTPIQELDRATIRFAGDSGDGMQLTGTQFTRTAAVFGNDIATLPDYPAEIRAPAGSLPGVSGFQISFSSQDIHTPGDAPDVLVAMNPAALKANLMDLPPGGAIIVNQDAFTAQNLAKVAYTDNPLTDGTLSGYNVFEIPISTLNARALEGLEMSTKQVDQTKNFFALGVMFWLYERSMEPTLRWIDNKFSAKPVIAEANSRALKAGYAFGETTEIFHTHYRVRPAHLPPGTYRNITGNEATALGFVAASRLAKRDLFYGVVPDHAGERHPPPALDVQALRPAHLPGRGRDRRDRRRDRRGLRRGDGDDRLLGARDRAQERGARARDDGGAAARRRRRPACRPLDGHADEDRAGGPAAGHVRPQRRGAAPGHRAGHARPSASTSRSRPGVSRSST